MVLIEDDEIDVVISYASNRLHRKVHAALDFVQSHIVERSKRCVFVAQCLDSRNSEHWDLLLRFHAMLDEMQVKLAGGFIREAHVGLLLQGYVHGTLPFGYIGLTIDGERLTRLNKPRRKIAVDSEGAARWVKQIFEWYANDRLDFHDIARHLLSNAAPPPPKVKQWTWTAVKRVIRNQRYVGDWSYGIFRTVWQSKADYGRQIRQDSPYHEHRMESLRIIDDDLFERAQLLADAKLHRGGRKRRSRGGQTLRDPLKGLLFCPSHDVPLRSSGTDGDCYACPRCKKIGQEQHLFSHANRHVARRKICGVILAWLRSQRDFVDEIVERTQSKLAKAAENDEQPIERLKIQLEIVDRRLRLAIQHLKGSEGEAIVETLVSDRESLVQEIKQVQQQQVKPSPPPTTEEVRKWLNQTETLLEHHLEEPEVAAQLNQLLRQLSGGRIEVEQAGEKKHHRGWLRAKLRLHLSPVANSLNEDARPSIIVDLRDETESDELADQIKSLWDSGLRVGQVARQIGRRWSFVRASLEAWYRKRSLPLPDIVARDRTIKRSSPRHARYHEISDAAWA
jgi:hypothetical protein